MRIFRPARRSAHTRPGGSARERDTGAAAVEFALVLPILILLVFGIIAFGIAFSGWLATSNAARESARAGVVLNQSCEEIAEAYISASGATLGLQPPITVSISRQGGPSCVTTVVATPSWQVGSWTTGSGATVPCRGSTRDQDQLQVVATSQVPIVIPLWGSPTVTLTGKGAFRCEFA